MARNKVQRDQHARKKGLKKAAKKRARSKELFQILQEKEEPAKKKKRERQAFFEKLRNDRTPLNPY